MKLTERTKQWIAWGAVSVVLTLVAIFLGVSYPAPPQPSDDFGIEELGTTHFTNIEAEDVTVTDDLTVSDDTTFTDDVAISGDLDINGGKLTLDADADSWIMEDSDDVISVTLGAGTGDLMVHVGNLRVGDGTAGGTLNGEDFYVEGYAEIDGELELDGALDADSTANFGDTATFSKGSGTALDVSSGGELNVDGTLDVNGAADFAAVTTLATNVENVIAPSVATLAVTYTQGAGGSDTLATVAAGEVWMILGCYANVTTNWDATAGDDAFLNVGDGNDADGLLDLDDAELQAADTEGTGAAAGWQGFMSADTIGAYFTTAQVPFLYGVAAGDTIDVAWGATGDDLTAGELTIYLVYIRIK